MFSVQETKIHTSQPRKKPAVMLEDKQKRLFLLLSQPGVAAKMCLKFVILVSIRCKKESNSSNIGVMIPVHTL